MTNVSISHEFDRELTNGSVDMDIVLDGFLSTKRSENTKRAYASDLQYLFLYLNVTRIDQLGQIMFHDLVDKIQSYLNQVAETDIETGRVTNPKTVNRKAYAFSSFFKYLVHTYGYPKNPLEQFQSHKVDRRSTTQSLTRAEVIDVIAHMKSRAESSQTAFRDYLAICFLSVLALRRSELVGLKWKDLNFETSSINIYQKGGAYKLLPLPTALLELLTEYRENYETVCDYIFSPVRNNSTNSLEKPLNTSYIYELVQKTVSKVANGKRATPHSFRKSFIELALNNQEDFISIINATGHTTVEMVKYYDTRDTLKNNAVHGMAKLL